MAALRKWTGKMMVGVWILLVFLSASLHAQVLSDETEKAIEAAVQNAALESRLETVDLSAKEFYAEIESEAQSFYETHKNHFPDVKRNAWDRMVRLSMLRLESLGIGLKALANYAKPAAGTFVVTNIVSTFLLPPILTAIGQPGLAILVLATPFEPMVAAGQVFVMRSFQDILLIRNIGFSEYLAIRKMRKELLGMSERAHVMSLIQEDIMKEMGGLSIVVTSDSISRGRNLSVAELERLVAKDPFGKQWIDTLLPLRNKRALYTLELWIYIQDRAELRSELLQTLKERLALDISDTAKQRISTQLHELLDLRKTLGQLEDQFSKSVKQNLKTLSSSEKRGLKGLLSEASAYSNQIKNLSTLAETHALWQMIHGQQQLVDLDSTVKMLRDTIRTFRAVIPVASTLADDRLVNEKVLREILRLPKASTKRHVSDCNQALQKLVKWGRYSF